jgi:hypothetical protein
LWQLTISIPNADFLKLHQLPKLLLLLLLLAREQNYYSGL